MASKVWDFDGSTGHEEERNRTVLPIDIHAETVALRILNRALAGEKLLLGANNDVQPKFGHDLHWLLVAK